MSLRDVVTTWTAYDRITGDPVTVDDRTFREAWHRRTPLSASELSETVEAPAAGPAAAARRKVAPTRTAAPIIFTAPVTFPKRGGTGGG
jgi:hypothetical protein